MGGWMEIELQSEWKHWPMGRNERKGMEIEWKLNGN